MSLDLIITAIVSGILGLLAIVLVMAYAFAVFSMARSFGQDTFLRRHRWLAFCAICIGSALPTCSAAVFPLNLALLVTIGTSIWLLHALPASLGFWIGLEDAQRREQNEREKRTDQWIRIWELEASGEKREETD